MESDETVPTLPRPLVASMAPHYLGHGSMLRPIAGPLDCCQGECCVA